MANCYSRYYAEKYKEIKNVAVDKKEFDTEFRAQIHWHDYYELEILVSGKAIHWINGKESVIGAGSVHLLSYYDYHSLKVVEDAVIIDIYFKPEAPDGRISQFLEKLGKTIACTFEKDELDYLVSRTDALSKEIESDTAASEHMKNAILSEIISLVLKKSETTLELSTPLPVQKAISYINSNFMEDLSLASLAEKLSVSTGYLGKSLKKSVNKTFNEYLGDVRLKYACRLLMSSSLSVSEIASASGYNSTTYFLYVFKKRFGITPVEYKKCNRSHNNNQD